MPIHVVSPDHFALLHLGTGEAAWCAVCTIPDLDIAAYETSSFFASPSAMLAFHGETIRRAYRFRDGVMRSYSYKTLADLAELERAAMISADAAKAHCAVAIEMESALTREQEARNGLEVMLREARQVISAGQMDYRRALQRALLAEAEVARHADTLSALDSTRRTLLAAENAIADLNREGDALRHRNACLAGKVDRMNEYRDARDMNGRDAVANGQARDAALAIIADLTDNLRGMTLSMLPANEYGKALFAAYVRAQTFRDIRK